jgi:hypothetical protein
MLPETSHNPLAVDGVFAAPLSHYVRQWGRGACYIGHAGPQDLCAVRETPVLNRYDHRSPGEAEVKYLDGDFRVMRPGTFVRCAVTGAQIPLDELKYWSVDRQEAYATPEAVLKRLYPERTNKP